MIDLNRAILQKISTHYVGNKQNDQELILSNESMTIDEIMGTRLKDYFLNPMEKVFERYRFTHSSSLDYNEVYNFVSQSLKEDASFHESSVELARHLFEKTEHPNIKSGELHICKFSQCQIDDAVVDAIGLFKTELKSGFFEIGRSAQQSFSIDYKEGIDLKKYDKGCLILDTDQKEGFDVIIIDAQSRGDEAKYWKDDFLQLTIQDNEYQQTKEFLDVAKQYITQQVTEEFEVEKTDQIDMLNRSVKYFKNNESFDQAEFAEDVFGDEKVAQSFKKFDHNYREDHDLVITDSFEISSDAVKKQTRIFKSVLKLDKNFHIYIHGDRNLIEKGSDENGRKFYKIYYDEEK
jgi:hypothetical protein